MKFQLRNWDSPHVTLFKIKVFSRYKQARFVLLLYRFTVHNFFFYSWVARIADKSDEHAAILQPIFELDCKFQRINYFIILWNDFKKIHDSGTIYVRCWAIIYSYSRHGMDWCARIEQFNKMNRNRHGLSEFMDSAPTLRFQRSRNYMFVHRT